MQNKRLFHPLVFRVKSSTAPPGPSPMQIAPLLMAIILFSILAVQAMPGQTFHVIHNFPKGPGGCRGVSRSTLQEI